jgi:hypothetical protein
MRFYRKSLSLKRTATTRHRHLVILRKSKQKSRQHRHIAFFQEIRVGGTSPVHFEVPVSEK